MTEISLQQLQQAVEARHGGTASFVQAVPIRQMQGEQLVWEGLVHIFDLADHPDGAFRAYALSHAIGGGKQRVFVVLHGRGIVGPRDAVHAALVAAYRTEKENL
jgi:hypothetical protein